MTFSAIWICSYAFSGPRQDLRSLQHIQAWNQPWYFSFLYTTAVRPGFIDEDRQTFDFIGVRSCQCSKFSEWFPSVAGKKQSEAACTWSRCMVRHHIGGEPVVWYTEPSDWLRQGEHRCRFVHLCYCWTDTGSDTGTWDFILVLSCTIFLVLYFLFKRRNKKLNFSSNQLNHSLLGTISLVIFPVTEHIMTQPKN